MITNEIKVNGKLIGHVYCHNTEITSDPITETTNVEEIKYVYSVQFYRIGDGGNFDRFDLIHRRSDGFEVLMSLIWKHIVKKNK